MIQWQNIYFFQFYNDQKQKLIKIAILLSVTRVIKKQKYKKCKNNQKNLNNVICLKTIKIGKKALSNFIFDIIVTCHEFP